MYMYACVYIYIYIYTCMYICIQFKEKLLQTHEEQLRDMSPPLIHYPKYDDNVSFQGLLKFAPT